RMEPLLIKDIVLRAADNMRLLAGERTLETAITKQASRALVNGDGDQLYRVLANLLDNAIRYTAPDGRIIIGLDLMSPEATPGWALSGRWVRMSVADDGCGI